MAEEHDSWLKSTFGVDVDAMKQKATAFVDNAVTEVKQDVQKAETWVKDEYQDVKGAVETKVADAKNWVDTKLDDAKKGVHAVKQALAGDESGKQVPRPMEADCKPEHGKVPGPKNHIYCGVHGHVLDTDTQQIIAASVAAYVKAGLGKAAAKVSQEAHSAASSALDAGNSLGKKVIGAESAAWDGTKKAYGAATGAYDSVAPDPTKQNKDTGKLVDLVEAEVKKGTDEEVAEFGDVPVLGSLVKGAGALENATTQVAGGALKGVSDLVTTAENATVHPIDAAVSMGEGALGALEHVPTIPGLATTLKGVHGAVDLARGKTDGKYGANWTDLGDNLIHDTQQDPDDPSKRVNTDVEFLADIGGGKKAWEDKPLEAATRTIVNIAPMFLGDEAAGTPEPVPEGGGPKGGPPGPRAVDPLADTQPGTNGPATQIDPAKPPEPEAPKANPADTPAQVRQNLIDASAAQKVTQQASIDATGEFVRYRAKMPRPEAGFAGDPTWDPVVDEALKDQAEQAEQANIKAVHKLNDARKAAKAMQNDAIAAAKQAKGGKDGS